mmetsp:Transcript_10622/g.26383  ORF Transcript_10622/g.26383 Transcript_10622/m.26383 type:complete len:270 (+) Transcript_10622:281-1090(+)
MAFNEDECRLCVLGLDLVQLINKLLIHNRARVIFVQDSEDNVHVILPYVQRGHELCKSRIVIHCKQQLFKRQVTGVISVEFFTKLEQLLLDFGKLASPVFDLPKFIRLARSVRHVDYNRHNQVHHSELDNDEHANEEDSSYGFLLNDRNRQLSPAVPCNNLLQESQVCGHHGRESSRASLTILPTIFCCQAICHGMQDFHSNNRKEREEHCNHDSGPSHGFHCTQKPHKHDVELSKQTEKPLEAQQTREPANTHHSEGWHLTDKNCQSL